MVQNWGHTSGQTFEERHQKLFVKLYFFQGTDGSFVSSGNEHCISLSALLSIGQRLPCQWRRWGITQGHDHGKGEFQFSVPKLNAGNMVSLLFLDIARRVNLANQLDFCLLFYNILPLFQLASCSPEPLACLFVPQYHSRAFPPTVFAACIPCLL